MKIFREVKGIPEPEGEENKEYRILQKESKGAEKTLEPAEEEQAEVSPDQGQEDRTEDIPKSEEKETITED